jgi:hypothetical protein
VNSTAAAAPPVPDRAEPETSASPPVGSSANVIGTDPRIMNKAVHPALKRGREILIP